MARKEKNCKISIKFKLNLKKSKVEKLERSYVRKIKPRSGERAISKVEFE
jgi:hypothetical protein